MADKFFFLCSFCERPAVRAGGCDECEHHFCHVHEVHGCTTSVDDSTYKARLSTELYKLQDQINDEAVSALASKLKGVACKVEHSCHIGPGALMGCANYHARILFNDGETWLLRVPRVTRSSIGLSEPLAAYLIQHEYATLKFLEHTTVPAPRVFEYGVAKRRHAQIGVTFLLMEELSGKPWDGSGNAHQRARIWDGLSDILVELSRNPFPVAGSLTDDVTGPISGIASDRFVVLSPEGPFKTPTAYYTAFTDQYLHLIHSGQLYTRYPVNAYLVYRFLKDNVGQLAEQEVSQFFLKHIDDKGDHLLLDDDFNITGIIDWQMARVVPWREAFGPSLVTVNMRDLCGGKVGLSTMDTEFSHVLKTKGLGRALYEDEKPRRFFWGLGLESEWKHALPLADAVLQTFGASNWDTWKEVALKQYGHEQHLQDLLLREQSLKVYAR